MVQKQANLALMVILRRLLVSLTDSECFLEWIRRVVKVVCLRGSILSLYLVVVLIKHVVSAQNRLFQQAKGGSCAISSQTMH